MAEFSAACEIVIQLKGGPPKDHRFGLLIVDCDGRCNLFADTPWTEQELTTFLEARYEAGVDIARRIHLARTQWLASTPVPRPREAERTRQERS